MEKKHGFDFSFQPDCAPCLVSVCEKAIRVCGGGMSKKWMAKVCRLCSDILEEDIEDLDERLVKHQPVTLFTQFYHKLEAELAPDVDPYDLIKKKANSCAKALLPALEELNTGFAASVRLACAGNVLDFAIYDAREESHFSALEEGIRSIVGSHPSLFQVEALEKLALSDDTKTILYITDNAGEIYLDTFLLRRLPKQKVTLVTRHHPIMNDVCFDDADVVEDPLLTSLVDNITHSGASFTGTPLAKCSGEFLKLFFDASLVIAKGQGNFETLCGISLQHPSARCHGLFADRDLPALFCCLVAKCDAVSRCLGVSKGEPVVVQVA